MSLTLLSNLPEALLDPITIYGAPERHSKFKPFTDSKSEEWVELYIKARDSIFNKGGIYCFWGTRGGGKTQMAVSLMNAVYFKLRKHVRYTTLYDMANGLIGAMSGGESTTGEKINVKTFTEPHLLVIDAVEVRKGSDFEIRELNNIIDKRYWSESKITIMVTNDTKEAFAELVGVSAMDRIRQSGGFVNFNQKSFR